MDTPDKQADDKLAGDFFTLSNIIAGFCAAQTFVFLLSLGKEVEVANYFAEHRNYTVVVSIIFSLSYLGALFGFFRHEAALRDSAGHSETVRRAARFAHIARIALVASIAILTLVVLTSLKVLPVPSPQTQSAK